MAAHRTMPFRRRHTAHIAAAMVLAAWAPFLAVRCVAVDTGDVNCWLLHPSEARHAVAAGNSHSHHAHQGQDRLDCHRHPDSRSADNRTPPDTCCKRSGKSNLQLPDPPASPDAAVANSSATAIVLPDTCAEARRLRKHVEPTAHAPPLYLSLRTLLV